MENSTENKDYMELIGSIRKGSINNEEKARKLIEQSDYKEHGAMLKELEEALEVGNKVKFERYALMLSRGITVYEEQARNLANRQGWDLEKAVEMYRTERLRKTA
jgi:hypothetical protein